MAVRISARGGALSLALLVLSGCGPSTDEIRDTAYSEGYAMGREEGHQDGKQEAIDCVRDEGGGADDAADSCE